jgi:hypothetical protein
VPVIEQEEQENEKEENIRREGSRDRTQESR